MLILMNTCKDYLIWMIKMLAIAKKLEIVMFPISKSIFPDINLVTPLR